MSSQPSGSRPVQIAATLQDIVGRVLRIDPRDLDIEAPFLELGADSLALVEALRGIQEAFGVKLTLRQLFEQLPTIAALAGHLEQTVGEPHAPEPPPPAPFPMAPPTPMSPPANPAPPAQVAPPAPLLTPLQEVRASAGLEKVLAMQIQAFNQLVAQQLQMLGSAPPSPALEDNAPAAPAPEALRPVLPTHLGKVHQAPELTGRQQAHLDSLVERYCRKTAKSKELTQRYRPWLADSRATVGFRPQVKEMLYPLARARSRGSRLWDVDGNEYVDVTMGMGVHLFGHDPDFLRETIAAQVREGFELGPRSAHSGEVAQLFCELTGMERATFTNSGTEAVMTAIRLARARTGRTRIAMFVGSYHGHSDGTLAQSCEAEGEIRSFPVAPGVPVKVAEDVLVLEYGADRSLDILRRHARELAAVIVEPIQSRRPDLQPREFLHELRRLTAEHGVALVFDEMVCGFRLHLGGAQAHFGVRADLATYGKIVGGGFPIGVVAGSAEHMDGIDGGFWRYGDDSRPERDTTFFGGTFCQHPLAMAAARTVLTHLKERGPALQENLNARTSRFAGRLNAWLDAEQLPFRIVSAHSLFRLQGSGNLELLYYHLVEKGIYVWEWRNCFLSAAHSDEDLDLIVRAFQESAEELRHGGFFPARPAAPSGGGRAQVGSWERKGIKPAIAPAPEPAAAPAPLPVAAAKTDGEVLFSLYFFGNYTAEFRAGKYDLILDCARFADRAGLTALWFPERHFHQFGGLSPNPSVLAAALSRETARIALRAGSVVLPLHHPVRVAEEWALVDNLSGGRIGLSLASGWHPNDFALAPASYGRQRELMFERAEIIQRLWRGETARLEDGAGSEVDLRISPLPSRRDLPVWITIVNNPDTYRLAGEMGAGVLTNLMGQTPEAIASNLRIYREALARAGHPPSAGHVALLLHTFLGPEAEQAIATARRPFHRYLESSVGLVKNAVASEGLTVDFDRLGPDDMEYMLELAYQRYVRTAALIGSPASVAPIVEHLRDLGVDEIACLIDFGVEPELVRQSLPWIAALQQRFRAPRQRRRSTAEPVRVPLTEVQRDLWTVLQLGPEASLAYLETGVLELCGPLDASLLRRALQQVVDRHEALRSVLLLPASGEEPFQEVRPDLLLDVPLIDLTGLPEARREEAVQQWLEAESRWSFDLARDPLVRATLLESAPRVHRLGLFAPHIVADGLSLAILLREALAIYEAGRAGRRAVLPEPLQLREHAAWLAAGGAEAPDDEAFWLQAFSGELPVFAPPTDRPRPPVRTFRGDRRLRMLPPELDRRLREVSRQQGATFFIGLLAAWSALLHRWTGQDDVIIGSPADRRPLAGGDHLVGHCVDLVPYRSRLGDREPTFAEHLTALRQFVLAAHEHGGYPMARLLRRLALLHDAARAPLINAALRLDSGPGITRAAGLELAERPPVITHARRDVALHVLEAGGEVAILLDFLRDLFDASTMDRLLEDLVTLIGGVTADVSRPLRDLPLLCEAARRQVAAEWKVESSPLVEIRPVVAGSRPPLFFVHPANGRSICYQALGRHLARDLPLYVLQSPGWTCGRLYTGMEAIASAYLEAVRSLQPRGPYRLGGWCVGGTFAYELARRLRALGEEIELLVLVDSHAPEPDHLAPHEEAALLASFSREIAGAAGKSLDMPLDELRRIPAGERLDWVMDTARKLEILPASFSPEQARWHWDVFRANVRAVEVYRPERQPLRTVLFRATCQIHDAEGKPSLGWARWITGRLEVVAVEGDHYDVIREPAVELVARGISDRLAPAPAAAAAP